ncbi:fatty acid desaturase family protein [Parendozoicomonas haliclonae]|uniref:Delta(12)-fatty-acid desaturase n=1 Tax=Parendozoicomonas haliclonae TaxID=1960125 RepID=A0A1X7AQU7_9GAMM|nr:fatty acid desaturase family protein [Parendozoicomonas haliclonae]SMA50512.1 Delta(12)-fatty-acid desaturase [Parendozoicomonas haliclonae]
MLDYLTQEEKYQFRKANDGKAWLGFLTTWAMIIASMALVAICPNVFTVLVALLVIGGRQLALGILLHDCSHRSWFSSQKLNDRVGHWLAGIPVLVPMSFYRPYHFTHHTKTGTDDDPDVGNIRDYPISKQRFKRKLFRDLTGQSGVKSLLAMLLYVNTGRVGNARAMGQQKKALTREQILRTTLINYRDLIVFHGSAFTLLWVLGQPYLYLLWWGAYLIPFQTISRIRQIAEHGAMPELSSDDVRMTTRTTLARWWERMLFAPHFVNYHCEHHFMPTVPGYHLKQLHEMVRERGFYQEHPHALAGNYREVVRRATQG